MRAAMKRLAALVLALLFAAGSFPYALGEGAAPALEVNTEYRTDLYPYLVRSESAVWYVARADIDAFGLEAMTEPLLALLPDMEQDFADAREALAGALDGDVPPIRICTDFCDHAQIAETVSGYYTARSNFIKVFHGWRETRACLLHEYVHYLTFTCCRTACREGFWAQGAAEYIARIVCVNRMSRSVNMGLSDEEAAMCRAHGAWDEEAGCVDERAAYFGLAELTLRGATVGQRYYAVSNEIIERTERIQSDPRPDELNFYEAACMVAYLAETYGEEAVFAHWDTDRMEDVFGAGFAELYAAWGEWNAAKCAEMGLLIGE